VAAPRFALEAGPFTVVADAERVELQLTRAGYQTVRFRQQTGGGVYAVLIERLAGPREAQTLLATLRERGFPDAVLAEPDPPVIRVGEPLPLRGAVELAERLRAQGQPVRVAAQAGDAIAYVVRHGNFASREEAAARASELERLGLPLQVIQVR
jgi:cell division protein FtsN